MNTLVKYNRKQKQYQLIDLTTGAIVATTSSGKQNKASLEAQQLHLEATLTGIDYTRLTGYIRDRVTHHPQLQGRVFRAALLLAGGHARHNGGPGRYDVDSQSRPGVTYHVTRHPRRACQCTDYHNGQIGHQHGAPILDGHPCCKHLLATDFLTAWEQEQIRRQADQERRDRDTALPISYRCGRSKLFKT